MFNKQLFTDKKFTQLLEANRQQLLSKSKTADKYAISNRKKGKTRYERRTKSSIATSVAQYNKIDMDALFKRDILTVGIEVKGETNNYIVTVKMSGVLKEVQTQVKNNRDDFNFRCVIVALTRVFNTGDVMINCNCEDGKYRFNYWQTKNNYQAGPREVRPSNITNPNDTKGAGCKHTLLVLANMSWLMKVASVIVNYVKYAKTHLERLYATYIFPKIYGMSYDKAVEINANHTGMLDNDLKDINKMMLKGRDSKGRFTKGNEIGKEYRFKKQDIKTPDNNTTNNNNENS